MACTAAFGGSGLFAASLHKACGSGALRRSSPSLLTCPASLVHRKFLVLRTFQSLPRKGSPVSKPFAPIFAAIQNSKVGQSRDERDVSVHAVSTGEAPPVVMGAGSLRSQGRDRELRKFEELEWDNTFVRELPADPNRNGPVRQVRNAMFSYVDPSLDVKDPVMIAFSDDAAENLLGLDAEE
jgi:hypothetical protein